MPISVLSVHAEEAAEATEAADAAANAVASDVTSNVASDVTSAAAPVAASATASESVRPRSIDTRIFRLDHCSAAEVAAKFNEMWNGEFGQVWKVTKMAVAFPESNSVMVSAPAPILDACEKAIAALDVEARQIYIEARFVELSNNASHKLGIDWQFLDSMGGTARLGGGIQHTRLGNAVSGYTRTTMDGKTTTSYGLDGAHGHDGDITYFNGTLDFSEMSVVLCALESAEDAKTFSNPRIIVASGKKAVVDMTTKYPNVTVAAKRTSNSNSDSIDLDMKMAEIPGEDKFMFAKEAFFSWGIQLEVTPRVGTNGLINVSIVPTISSQTDWVTAGANDTSSKKSDNIGSYSAKYPVIDVQRLVTDFAMADGSTAVIGGLSRTTEEQMDSGIPYLRDIPWIGNKLFGGKTRQKVQKEILVFVTVGFASPNALKNDVGLPKNAVLGKEYTSGFRKEPGDRKSGVAGVTSLDLRPIDEQAADPAWTNRNNETEFRFPLPFTKKR